MSWPNTELAVVERLRTYAPLVALIPKTANPLQARVFMGVPDNVTDADWPLITVPGRVGGGQADGQAPIDAQLIQVNVRGRFYPGTKNGDKPGLHPVHSAVRDALDIYAPVEISTSSGVVRLLGSEVESDIWLPDEDDDRPRYSITASVVAVAVP